MQKRELNPNESAVVLAISGMTCSGCANTVERVLSKVPGVAKAEVHLPDGRAVVAGSACLEELIAAPASRQIRRATNGKPCNRRRAS